MAVIFVEVDHFVPGQPGTLSTSTVDAHLRGIVLLSKPCLKLCHGWSGGEVVAVSE